ncbi:MAG: molybdopterin-binding protein [Planctomycetota bacterium]
MRRAVVLGVGDELLRGDIVDLNTPFLARALLQAGWTLVESRVLPDDLPLVAATVRELRRSRRS